MTSRKLLLSAAMFVLAATPAFADATTEEYVRTNANDALASLNAPGVTPENRRLQFQEYMDQFANLDAVAKFAIGQ
jgi:phospholipid transport system substrate-binding protein